MPHTVDPAYLDTTVAHPVIPQGHGKPGYTTEQELPTTAASPTHSSRPSSRPASRPGSRSASPFREIFRRTSSHGRTQEEEQRENALRQAGTAQDASYEADLERAVRRSKREEEARLRRERGESPAGAERSDSHGRGLSRVRAAIRELVNDPFWHRPSKDEAAHQDEEMKRIILEEVHKARASTEAGKEDRRAGRSHSRIRSPLASQPASRSASHVREEKKEESVAEDKLEQEQSLPAPVGVAATDGSK
ncbi:hypothetical protein JCM8202_003617 [Rhodotorula sphaerocarpa]